ncbi:hypothetical protein TRM7557_03251 [Tritonibacter multivorans]|uniref:Uncharacterized protein n=1 Tax=Tritonibacter multivorans TaxID=928856 RepID=A0A0P1GGR6_9RHOB|nr:hypothetical protein [Tritonibacter multivorans]MDA7420689.1 hypothetical protein [Tritonibacter multivorans]CUH81123.1 hypothetical protein TRM7557_03251 [Tritonibacter multivorans]SFC28782.1 hypothetical protein SAMN04488049_10287 [Tritonibacter multivorans]
MTFIADNQLILLIAFFLAGCTGTWRLFAKPAGHRAWKIADLVWVVLGGIGAIVAVVAGIYSADTSRLERQIDIAYAATRAFDTDAARFRLRFCDPAYDSDTATLCEKIEFLSASTAENADLPLFIAVTDRVSPLRKLDFFRSTDMEGMEEVAAFDPDAFLVFASLDDPTRAAVDNMRRKVPTIAGDFLILARAYDDLIEQTRRLRDEWRYLQSNAYILVLQVLALCLVSFAAPFRLGKSIVDLRG